MIDRVRVLTVATFREAIRDRILLVVVLFAIGVVLFSRVLGWLSIEDELKMVQDFSLSGLGFLGMFLAMLLGASSLAREVERRTVYTVLTRTCGRGEFIVGKFLGLTAAFWLCLIGCAALLAVWLLIWGGWIGAGFYAAVLGLLVESLVLTSAALFLGALSNASIAAVGTFCFYLVGHSTEALRELTKNDTESTFSLVFGLLYRVLPNLENVNYINATTSGDPIAWSEFGLGAASMLIWTVVFLAGAMVLFRRRQF